LSKNHIFTVFTSNYQCVRFAARRRIEAGDATGQPNQTKPINQTLRHFASLSDNDFF